MFKKKKTAKIEENITVINEEKKDKYPIRYALNYVKDRHEQLEEKIFLHPKKSMMQMLRLLDFRRTLEH